MPTRSLPLAQPRLRLRRLVRFLLAMLQARRDRLALRRLDDHLLRDIGLTPDEARQEAARWDPPPHWRD